jgi:dipeptidyl aminopeptidase/acylaminoacyl peptidase
LVCVAAAGVAVIGIGAATAEPHRSTRPPPKGGVAVVVESGGKSALVVLAADAKGWRVVSRRRVTRGIRSMSWMPTGRKLAVSTFGGNLSNELRVIDPARGAQRVLATAKRAAPAAFFGSLAWSRDGRRIAVTRSMGLYGADINILDASKGSLVRSFHVSARFDSALAWSRDGRSLYFAEQKTGRTKPKLRQLGVATGKVLPINGVRGLDPRRRADGALSFTADDGIRVLQNGRVRKVAGSKRGDRLATWEGKLLLVERPAPGCPRYVNPVCSHVVVLMRNGRAPRYLLNGPARNPATR